MLLVEAPVDTYNDGTAFSTWHVIGICQEKGPQAKGFITQEYVKSMGHWRPPTRASTGCQFSCDYFSEVQFYFTGKISGEEMNSDSK